LYANRSCWSARAATTRPRISAEVSPVRSPAVSEKLLSQGLFPVGGSGGEFGALMRRYYDDYGRIVREANMKID